MSAKQNWKPVTIGGLTGIVLGAGTMYAIQSRPVVNEEETQDNAGQDVTAHEPQTSEVPLSILSVSDDLSFSEAFAAGRAASGPGGLFTWHGNVYGTYTADEWAAMSDEEKDLFADNANIAVRAAITEAPQVPDEEMCVEENFLDDNDVQVAEVSSEKLAFEEKESSEEPSSKLTASWDDITSEDSDVRVIGYGDVKIEGDQSVYVEEVEINGQRVAVIDVDKDGEADFAMTDLNHNYQMDDGEVIDLHTGETLTFTNDETTDDFSNTTNTDDSSDVELGMI